MYTHTQMDIYIYISDTLSEDDPGSQQPSDSPVTETHQTGASQRCESGNLKPRDFTHHWDLDIFTASGPLATELTTIRQQVELDTAAFLSFAKLCLCRVA